MSYPRSSERNRRLRKLSKATERSCRGGAYYDTDRRRYVRYYLSKTGYARYLRKQANRKVRRSTDLHSGNHYRKKFDYWWSLF